MEHNVGSDRQHVFIQCLLLIYVTPAGRAQVIYSVFSSRGGGGALFSDVGPELWRQTDVCWTPLSGENASLTLRWATIAGAEGKHHLRLSRRYAPLALQQMFRCGRPTAIHFLRSTERAAACTSAEEDQRTQVEQHPSLHKSKHRGRTRKRQARLKACVRIMPSRHLNNGQF